MKIEVRYSYDPKRARPWYAQTATVDGEYTMTAKGRFQWLARRRLVKTYRKYARSLRVDKVRVRA